MSKNILICYDVSDKHSEVKKLLQNDGFMDNWNCNNEKQFLPNTTLWKNDTTESVAINTLKNIATRLKIKLIRGVAVNFSGCHGIPGEAHS